MMRIVMTAVLVLLTGCATMTFKRGAGPGSMTADEDACRKSSADEAAYAACLRERGWLVAGKGTGAPPVEVVPEAPVAAPAAAAQPVASPPPVAAAPAAPVKGGTSVEIPPPAKAPSAPSVKSSAKAPPVNAAPVPAEVVTAPVAAPSAAGKPLDPLTRIDVASWWKLGGTASELERAKDKCAAELGPAHKPDPGSNIVTVGMRDCLRQAKWFPLGHSAAR